MSGQHEGDLMHELYQVNKKGMHIWKRKLQDLINQSQTKQGTTLYGPTRGSSE